MLKVKALVITLFLTHIFSTAYCSEWDKYITEKDKFHFIDRQDFTEITCNIEVPILTDLLIQVKAQVDPLKNNIEIKENLEIIKEIVESL